MQHHSDADIPTEAEALAAFVGREAAGWYPELGDTVTEVIVVSSSVRTRSHNHHLRIHAAGESRDVLAKVTSFDEAPARAGARQQRPMLGTPADFGEKHSLEYESLALAHHRIGESGDPRLASVRALAHIPERKTLILEYVDAPNLAALVRSRSLRRTGSRPLEPAFMHAGAWLRAYHNLSKSPAGTRRSTRAEFIDDLESYRHYLANHGVGRRPPDELVDAIKAAAERALPEQPVLVLGHGDAAMRNVLVLPDDRVAMFDMLGRWAVPLYEDLAYFTLSVRLNGLQGATQGIAYKRTLLRRYEEAFLTGYFAGQSIPRAAIGAYQLLVLLDRWAARADVPLPPTWPRRGPHLVVERAMVAAFRREASRIIGELNPH